MFWTKFGITKTFWDDRMFFMFIKFGMAYNKFGGRPHCWWIFLIKRSSRSSFDRSKLRHNKKYSHRIMPPWIEILRRRKNCLYSLTPHSKKITGNFVILKNVLPIISKACDLVSKMKKIWDVHFYIVAYDFLPHLTVSSVKWAKKMDHFCLFEKLQNLSL